MKMINHWIDLPLFEAYSSFESGRQAVIVAQAMGVVPQELNEFSSSINWDIAPAEYFAGWYYGLSGYDKRN